MKTNLNSSYEEELMEAILSFDDPKLLKGFLQDLCTINELTLMSQRFAVAKMLTSNKTYQEISEKTGASTATISRVSRALNFGTGGYQNAIEGVDK